MKVALISLPTRSAAPQIPNLGTIAIAQTVRDLGHEVCMIDVERHRYSTAEVVTEVEKASPDLVGLSGIITSYYFFEPLSMALRDAFPELPQIIGGSLTSAADLIRDHCPVDYMVKGEGENCVTELLARLSAGETSDLSSIPGLFVRDGADFSAPVTEQSYPDLSTIPIPAYDLYDMEYYIDACSRIAYHYLQLYPEIRTRVGENTRFFPIVLTRGCPYACNFCYRLVTKFRHPDIDYAITYLKKAKHEYGCDGISLLDELTITDRRWFSELCDAIAEEVPGLHIFFGAGKVNLVTPEVIQSARKAGFVRFGCGIESGSQTMLDSMNKKTTVEQNREAILLTKEAEMMASCNIMFGNPGENDESVRETERFLAETLDPRDFSANLAVAYPGTPLFDHAVSTGLLKKEDIHEYVLNTSWGDYPLNFSEFKSADAMRRRVRMVKFRLRFKHELKSRNAIGMLGTVTHMMVIEAYEWVKMLSPALAGAVRTRLEKKTYRKLAMPTFELREQPARAPRHTPI